MASITREASLSAVLRKPMRCFVQVVAWRGPGTNKRTNLRAHAVPTLTDEQINTEWDAVVVGSGVGGLTTATEMASKGAKVLVLESYIIPGGSAGMLSRHRRFAILRCMI